jgi:membrane fusion protein (multidrug efflux system)
MTVAARSVALATELPGRTSAYRVAEIRPQVNGIILKRLFTEGSEVTAGQVLYQIDPAQLQATLDNAKAALGKAEGNRPAIRLRAERLQELIADKAVSQQEVDDAAAALKQSDADIQFWKAMVTTAQINLGYARITAPVSGRIGKSNVTEGALVTAHQPLPLATIQQLDPLYVDVPQSTTQLLRWKSRQAAGRLNPNGAGQKKVKLILEDGTVYAGEGTLQFRDVTVDPSTGAVTLRVVFPNPQGVLLPGMFVRTVVQEGVQEGAILIPQQAVGRDPKGNPVALIVAGGGKVEQRLLGLDRAMGDQWLVTSGLTAGDHLIVEGLQKVRPGATVKTVPFQEGGTGGAAPARTGPPAPPAR